MTNESKGNTEGSFTEEEKEILVGCLLGDGAMRKKKNALLEINHSIRQKELVDFLFNKFKRFVGTGPSQRKGNGTRIAYRFTTLSLPCFTKIYDLFFKRGKKFIPQNLKLTERILAFWFMDDGSKSWKTVYLNTQQFSYNEHLQLLKKLKDDLGLLASINKDKCYYRIRIKYESMNLFSRLVKPYLLKSFYYKLP